MGELSIKVKVANRVYPLTVGTQEEEGIRRAADTINSSISEFEKVYAVKDKQDLLAMVALKIASRNFELKTDRAAGGKKIESNLTEVEALLDQCL